MDDRAPVVIVGAGIVGVATAVWLRRLGLPVTLIDRAGPAAGASQGNGGILAASAVVPVTVPGLLRRAPGMLSGALHLRAAHLPRLVPFAWRYLRGCRPEAAARAARALAPLLADSLADHRALAAGTGAEARVIACDYVYLYRDRAAFAADAFGWDLRAAAGFAWAAETGAAFRAAEPGFAADHGLAIRLGGHGRIDDPGAYVRALAAHVERAGGRVLRGAVEAVTREGGRVTGVIADGVPLPASAVVLAAGAWSGRLARTLGLAVPLESERGYHLDLWEPSWMPSIPVMDAARKIVVTPMAGRLRLAGLVEFGGLAAGPSPRPLRVLRETARALLPGLRWAREETWLGHRPATADSIPVIGAIPGIAGAFAGFGHHHVGLTAGAATGRLLAQIVAGRRVNIDLAPYAPARFQ